VIPDIDLISEDLRRKLMFVITTICFFLIMLTSIVAMPISGTHAIIGAFLGAGWISTSFKTLGWTKLRDIIISWVAAPVLSGLISYIIFMAVMIFTIESKKYKVWYRILTMQIIVGIAFAGIFDVLVTLLKHNFTFDS
jgi:phosphate/sulfate permease